MMVRSNGYYNQPPQTYTQPYVNEKISQTGYNNFAALKNEPSHYYSGIYNNNQPSVDGISNSYYAPEKLSTSEHHQYLHQTAYNRPSSYELKEPNEVERHDSPPCDNKAPVPNFPWMHYSSDDGKRRRQTYTRRQTLELEKEFCFNEYLTKKRRSELCMMLELTEKQIKTWFQNRRMKKKKEKAREKETINKIGDKIDEEIGEKYDCNNGNAEKIQYTGGATTNTGYHHNNSQTTATFFNDFYPIN